VLRSKEVVELAIDLCSKESSFAIGLGPPIGAGQINFR
jgi:hypothetical protein